MDTHGRAMHVRTGERSAAEVVDEWLARHDIQTIRARDAFEAVVTMLTQAATAPQLAFVGTDYLDPEDRAVFEYLRETWPHIGIVAYGAAPVDSAAGRVIVCPTVASMRELLAAGPANLVRRAAAAVQVGPSPETSVCAERDKVVHPGLVGEGQGGIIADVDTMLSADELNELLDRGSEPPPRGIL